MTEMRAYALSYMYNILRAISDKFQELDHKQNLCYNKEKERKRELWRNLRK